MGSNRSTRPIVNELTHGSMTTEALGDQRAVINIGGLRWKIVLIDSSVEQNISGQDLYNQSLFGVPYAFLRTKLKRTSGERSGNTWRTHRWTKKTWVSWSREYAVPIEAVRLKPRTSRSELAPGTQPETSTAFPRQNRRLEFKTLLRCRSALVYCLSSADA